MGNIVDKIQKNKIQVLNGATLAAFIGFLIYQANQKRKFRQTLKQKKGDNSKHVIDFVNQVENKLKKQQINQDLKEAQQLKLIKKSNLLVIKNAKLVYSKSKTQLTFLKGKTVIVKDGIIRHILDDPYADRAKYSQLITIDTAVTQVTLTQTQFLMPGLIDTHAHAPQFAFTGSGLDLQLLEWLDKYTFPCESKFKDLQFAQSVYSKSVQTHLKNGTTTICYFGTIHLPATQLLANLMGKIGMRGYVGKVCMDQNSPDWYRQQSAEQSLKQNRQYIEWFKDNPISKLVHPILTPRFAITCTRQLMQGLSKIAEENSVHIQTHLSQNLGEIQFVKQLFPQCKNYTDVYNKYGLLTNKTVLAHCIYLDQSQLDIIKQKGCGMSHCPNSNMSICSGIMPIRSYLDRGLKVSLGTDVAGGFSPSLFDAIRKTIGKSKILNLFKGGSPLSLAEGIYLATCGGAQVLGLENQLGTLTQGKVFDALVIDYSTINGYVQKNAKLQDMFQKTIYLMDDRQIVSVYVDGKKINFD